MDPDDPFRSSTDADRTLLKPTPGGRRPEPQQATPPPRSGPHGGTAMLPRTGLNPLVAAANPLLGLVAQLRHTVSHPDPRGLHEHLVLEIRNFEAIARRQGISPETVMSARYALCTLIDETVLSTPWGSNAGWGSQSLLVTFHNEAWGGEKFFQLLKKLMEYPAGTRDLLELLHVCLALGFEGRYRVSDGGRARIEELRDRVYQTLRAISGDFERDLSPHWHGVIDQRNPLIRLVPLWVVGAVAGILLVGLFLGFRLSLNRVSDPVFASLHGLRFETTRPVPLVPVAKPAPGIAKELRLKGCVQAQIDQRLLTVQEDPDKATVRLLGDTLFASGSASINPAYHLLLGRIADCVNEVPGRLVVTGHTDDRPITSLKFKSNWELSLERARAVSRILAARIQPPGRLKSEGRADLEPVAPNDTPDNRARNRRVEITLLARGH